MKFSIKMAVAVMAVAAGGAAMAQSTFDKINSSGLGKVRFASQGLDQHDWMMKREHLSPHYTTSWDDLPKAK